jgi:hypothetical protein
MSDPTDSFPSNPDLYRLLAQMYGVGLFTPSPAPGLSGYAPQSTFDPLLALGLDSNTPGFHKSPAVLEALSANDPRPPGFYRSTALLGARALLPIPDPNLPSPVGQQAMLFGGPGSAPMLPPLPAPWSDYVRAQYAPDLSPASPVYAFGRSDLLVPPPRPEPPPPSIPEPPPPVFRPCPPPFYGSDCLVPPLPPPRPPIWVPLPRPGNDVT